LPPDHIEDSHPGASAIAQITVPGVAEPLIVISIYGVIEKAGNGTSYATTSVGRMLSDMTPLLDATRRKAPVLIGGDFNCSTQIERADRAAHEAVFNRLAAFGLADAFAVTAQSRGSIPDCFCARKGACAHQRTLRHSNRTDSRPWQIDYFFTHHIDTDRLSVRVHDDERAWALSDHAPVVLTIDL
jgi:endonuclease/exonuclease/phosphatase family metal-dependent hydrolase